MSQFKMENHNYYDNAETCRNRWFDNCEGIQNEDFHLNRNERIQNEDSLSDGRVKASTKGEAMEKKEKNGAEQKKKRTLSQSLDMRKTVEPVSQSNANAGSRYGAERTRYTGEGLDEIKMSSMNSFDGGTAYSGADDDDKAQDSRTGYEDHGRFFKEIEKKERKWHEKASFNVNISTIKMLGALYRNVSAQKDALKVILPHVDSESLSRLLFGTLERYRAILIEIDNLASKYNASVASNTSMSRMLNRANLRVRLLGSFNSSGVVECQILNSVTGVMELGKLIRSHDIAPDVYSLSAKYIEAEEAKIERLKYYI